MLWLCDRLCVHVCECNTHYEWSRVCNSELAQPRWFYTHCHMHMQIALVCTNHVCCTAFTVMLCVIQMVCVRTVPPYCSHQLSHTWCRMSCLICRRNTQSGQHTLFRKITTSKYYGICTADVVRLTHIHQVDVSCGVATTHYNNTCKCAVSYAMRSHTPTTTVTPSQPHYSTVCWLQYTHNTQHTCNIQHSVRYVVDVVTDVLITHTQCGSHTQTHMCLQ